MSFAASVDGISSVGTATPDTRGALRVVENTITSRGQVVFDILQATYRKEQQNRSVPRGEWRALCEIASTEHRALATKVAFTF